MHTKYNCQVAILVIKKKYNKHVTVYMSTNPYNNNSGQMK